MIRILIRAGKPAATAVSVAETLEANLIGNNSGNALFAYAVERHLSVPGTVFEVDGYHPSRLDAERINSEFDHFVLPLANAFRPRFIPQLRRYTSLIEKLRIPVTVVGVGLQAPLRGGVATDSALHPVVTRFLKAVLNRSEAVGVRGARTAEYVKSLGFNDVVVIGCPSMFLQGARFNPRKRSPRLGSTARIAVTITEGLRDVWQFAVKNLNRFPNTTYIPQDIESLRVMWKGEGQEGGVRDLHSATNPFFERNAARFFVDPAPWIDFLHHLDFCYGSRVHGTIAALQAGIPACLIAHDARTLELAQFLGVPYVERTNLPKIRTVAQLYDSVDLDDTKARYPALLANYRAFLERNRLSHTLNPGQGPIAFDERIRNTMFPPAVTFRLPREPAGRDQTSTPSAGTAHDNHAAGESSCRHHDSGGAPEPPESSHAIPGGITDGPSLGCVRQTVAALAQHVRSIVAMLSRMQARDGEPERTPRTTTNRTTAPPRTAKASTCREKP